MLFLSLFMIWACKQNSSGSITYDRAGLPKELSSLYNEVLAIHDEAMPELETITRYQEQLKTLLDSLRTNTAEKQRLKEVNTVLGGLNKAENAMWTWMHNFSRLDSVPDLEKEAFLIREKASATDMNELIKGSIQQAAIYLSK